MQKDKTAKAKAFKAFSFFLSNKGKIVSVKDIVQATGWAESTVRTYITKKWSVFLQKKRQTDI